MSLPGFEDLEVWQRSHALLGEVYAMTTRLPRDEKFGAQLRRAAASIPTHIAEGFVRRGKEEQSRAFEMARSAMAECQYYLELTRSLGYAETAQQTAELERISEMLDAEK